MGIPPETSFPTGDANYLAKVDSGHDYYGDPRLYSTQLSAENPATWKPK